VYSGVLSFEGMMVGISFTWFSLFYATDGWEVGEHQASHEKISTCSGRI